MPKRLAIVIVAILIWVLPFVTISLTGKLSNSGPTRSIPNGLLYPLVPECEKFIRYHDVDFSQPIPHVPVAQHPFMSLNPGSNMHCDAYISDTSEASGPMGVNAKVSSRTQGFGGYGTITFDSQNRLVAVYSNARLFQLELIDPYNLEELASYNLPPRPLDFFLSGVMPWEYIGAGMYFYLDNEDRAVIPTTKNTIEVVQTPMNGGDFELVREYDLTDYLASDMDDSIAFILPSWDGEYYWYATTAGIVGALNRETEEVYTMRFEEEIIENSFAVGEDGVFMISDKAFYRFNQDDDGEIIIDWKTEYDQGPKSKPGHITRGSGTSVTLAGSPEDGLVIVADNAEPKVSILFIKRSDGELVCSQPVFTEGKSGSDLTAIGFEHADENGDGTGVFTAILENNWGHHLFPFRCVPEPGLTRVDAARHDDGTYTCEEIWASNERSIGGFRLSFGNGLVYMYLQDESGGFEPKWYLTAIDFTTGETVYKQLTGTGLGYNNWAGCLFLHPDGMAYSTTIFGMVMIQDTY